MNNFFFCFIHLTNFLIFLANILRPLFFSAHSALFFAHLPLLTDKGDFSYLHTVLDSLLNIALQYNPDTHIKMPIN